MTTDELNEIYNASNAAIIAPAGHGKTEMIADMVKHAQGKVLLLTHTNAGVSALTRRIKKKKIHSSKYTVTTIASFCSRWCFAYSNSACINKSLSVCDRKYYDSIYEGARLIFSKKWAQQVLTNTYEAVIVDEYQDCTDTQHELFLIINEFMRVIVLGDPMQGIFDWAGKIVDWDNLDFQVFNIETKPWRWINAGTEELGDYLSEIRKQVYNIMHKGKGYVSIQETEYVKIIPPSNFNCFDLLDELKKYTSVAYITKWGQKQLLFSQQMSGNFQNDEKVACEELFDFAKAFDYHDGLQLIISVIEFAKKCMTKVSSEMQSYIHRLSLNSLDFSMIKKHREFGMIINENNVANKRIIALRLLKWFAKEKCFKKYRTELLYEMIRSIEYSIEYETTIYEAANIIRANMKYHKDYNGFSMLSSRTVLCKGLEFDAVIIDMGDRLFKDRLSAKDFYVAMTRATRKIYIISNSTNMYLEK